MSYTIYIHVPFCVQRCRYCNFYSGEDLRQIPSFPSAVVEEANLRRGEFPAGDPSSLYMGGGTPSLLGNANLDALLRGISLATGSLRDAEVTVEVNPASALDFEKLCQAGVNRVSIGVQSLFDRHLKALGRPHTAREARATVEAAVKSGLRVSADLMYGYLGVTTTELLESAKELLNLGVSHISAYSLEVKEDIYGLEEVPPCSGPEEEAQAEGLAGFLLASGFNQYEVSNFSLPGEESRHNTGYWEMVPTMGLGPGAHGYLPGMGEHGARYWNEPSLESYLGALNQGELPPFRGEYPSAEELLLEKLFLTLRRRAPFSPAWFSTSPQLSPLLKTLCDAGDLLPLANGSFLPTTPGLRRADGIALWLHENLLSKKSK